MADEPQFDSLHEQWVAAIADALGWRTERVQWLLDEYDPPEDDDAITG
jgi:hypothetical protein